MDRASNGRGEPKRCVGREVVNQDVEAHSADPARSEERVRQATEDVASGGADAYDPYAFPLFDRSCARKVAREERDVVPADQTAVDFERPDRASAAAPGIPHIVVYGV